MVVPVVAVRVASGVVAVASYAYSPMRHVVAYACCMVVSRRSPARIA